jgi:ATP-dependent Zn protease
MFVGGVGASLVRYFMLNRRKKNAPCIIFYPMKSTLSGTAAVVQLGQNEREQTLNQLLVGWTGLRPMTA